MFGYYLGVIGWLCGGVNARKCSVLGRFSKF